MKKKIAISFLVIAVMCALVGGATFAWFTDKQEVAGNTFSTGTLVVGSDLTSPVSFTNLAPNWSQAQTLNIKNDGSLDAYYRVSIVPVTNDELYGPDGTTVIGHISDDILFTIGGTSYTLTQLINNSPIVDTINAGTTQTFSGTMSIPSSVGNEAQDKNFIGTFKLEAVQKDNNSTPVWN